MFGTTTLGGHLAGAGGITQDRDVLGSLGKEAGGKVSEYEDSNQAQSPWHSNSKRSRDSLPPSLPSTASMESEATSPSTDTIDSGSEDSAEPLWATKSEQLKPSRPALQVERASEVPQIQNSEKLVQVPQMQVKKLVCEVGAAIPQDVQTYQQTQEILRAQTQESMKATVTSIATPSVETVAQFPQLAEVVATCVVKTPSALGEGAIWDDRSKRLLWLDILCPTLNRLNPKDGSNEAFPLGDFGVESVSSVVPLSPQCDESGDLVGLTLEDSFAVFDCRTKSLTKLPRNGLPAFATGERFNDGKVDPRGRYWAGTLRRDADNGIMKDAGTLYRRNADGSVDKVLDGVSISNGVVWDEDLKTMYYIDTPSCSVDALDYDVATGDVSNRRPLVTGFCGFNEPAIGEIKGFPDGCCMDKAGRLWVACFGGGQACLFDLSKPQESQLVGKATVPRAAGVQTTSVALSADGDLYITTAREDFTKDDEEKYPLAGSLFIVVQEELLRAGLCAEANELVPSTRGFRWVPPSSQRLKGKVAVVTGSSQGIGYGCVVRLAREGCKTVVNYLSDAEGAEVARLECESFGGAGSSIKVQADVGKKEDCENLIAAAKDAFGTIDILVNNAGIEKLADFWDVTEADYDSVMQVNMKGAFFTSQAFVKVKKYEGKPGTIINMSSVHEDLPFPGFSPYCCSKGAMKMFTRNLGIELAPLGITINNIAPGAIETPINAAMLKQPEKLAELLGNIPLRRLGQPSDISGCLVYLASDEAGYVTGSTFVVDGGLTWNYVEKH